MGPRAGLNAVGEERNSQPLPALKPPTIQPIVQCCTTELSGRCEMYAEFLSENRKGRDHSEDLGVDGKIILEWILGKQGGKVWTGLIWLRLGTSGGPL